MDAPMGDGTRWVTLAPSGAQTASTLAKDWPNWSPDKVVGFSGVIIEVDDVYRIHEQLKKVGVKFTEIPRSEPLGGTRRYAQASATTSFWFIVTRSVRANLAPRFTRKAN